LVPEVIFMLHSNNYNRTTCIQKNNQDTSEKISSKKIPRIRFNPFEYLDFNITLEERIVKVIEK